MSPEKQEIAKEVAGNNPPSPPRTWTVSLHHSLQKPEPSNYDRILGDILCKLGVVQLGEGNVHHGISVLIAMCNALCAVRGPGSLRDNPPGISNILGLNLLVTDPEAARLIHNRIVRPIGELQNRLFRVVNAHNEKLRETELIANKMEITPLWKREEIKAELDRLHPRNSGYPSPIDLCRETAAVYDKEVYRRPRFFCAGVDPKAIAAARDQAHVGRMLWHCPVSRLEEVDAIDATMNAFIGGAWSAKPLKREVSGQIVGGFAIAAVSEPVLSAMVNPDCCAATWPSRFLWLPPKITFEQPPILKGTPAVNLIDAFPVALNSFVEERLKFNQTRAISSSEFANRHQIVVEQVRKLAGVSAEMMAAAGPLFSTLLAGLSWLVPQGPNGEKVIEMAEVGRLTSRVITSSAAWQNDIRNRQAVLMQKKLASQVLEKLRDRPLSLRDLMRKFHKIGSEQCREALQWLEQQGQIYRENDLWSVGHREPGIASKASETSHPVIDVPSA